MDSETWIALIGGIFGGGGITAGTTYLRNRASDRAAERAAEKQQPIDHYNSLVTKMEARIDKLETDHRLCMDQHAEGQRQVGELHGRLEELRGLVKTSVAQASAGGGVNIKAEKLEVASPANLTITQPGETKP